MCQDGMGLSSGWQRWGQIGSEGEMVKVNWDNKRATDPINSEALKVCRRFAEAVKGDAVNVCPIKSGTLRGTAAVNDIKNGSEISFNTPYAEKMHESHYIPSHPGTGPNYLRGPLMEKEKAFQAALKAAIK